MASDLPTADDLRKTRYPNGVALAARTYASPQRDRLTEQWDSIEQAITAGRPIRRTLDAMGIDYGTFYDFMEQSPAHAERYARARERRADHWHEKAEEASDRLLSADSTLDANAVNAMRAGLSKIDWLTKVLDPKRYGDHKTLAVDVTHRTPLDELTDEQLQTLVRKRGSIEVESVAVGTNDEAEVNADKSSD